MRHDRQLARLSLPILVATTSFVASVVVPLRFDAIMPATGDSLAGWCLLVTGVVVSTRSPGRSALLLGAGALWVLVGLAPLLPTTLGQPVARTALLPTAMVAVCTLSLPSRAGRSAPAWRTWRLPAAVAVGSAVVGGLGAYQFSLLVIGVAVVSPGWPREARARAVRAVFGTGTLVVGLASAGVLDLGSGLLASLHDVVIIIGAAGTAWVLTTPVRATAGIELDEPRGLDRAVADLLEMPYVEVVLPSPTGGWLDAAGRPAVVPDGAEPLLGADGTVLAMIAGVGGRDPDRTVRRLLAAAARGAVLRAELRDRAEEIVASRDRLSSAAEEERRRLVRLIEAGPVATLDRIARDLERAGAPDLSRRVAGARSDLLGVVSGLDPVADGLAVSLQRLVDGSGARLHLGVDPQSLSPTHVRAVWFTAAEGLANASRHAPGADVRLSLDAYDGGVRLAVGDDGPGGADPSGSGLAGLRARAASVGGRLTVRSSPRGTELLLDLPARVEGKPQSGSGLTPIPRAVEKSRVEA